MQTIVLPAWIGISLFATVIALALWKGGPTERICAAAMIAAWIATEFVQDHRWPHSQIGVFVVDGLLLALLVALALLSRRFWPMWAAGFQLLAVLTHAARLMDPKVGAWAYVTAGIIWAYLTIFALAFGTWGAWRDRRKLARADAPAVGAGA